MNTITRILGLACAALGLACADHDASGPAFDFMNGPASPGNSGVFRIAATDFFFAVHTEAGLIVIHGLQNTMADLCTGVGELDLVDLQLKPQSGGEIQALIKNETSSVQILPRVPLTCAALSAAPVLYRGTATLLNTDNNFTPTGTEGQRASSFGWIASGVLDDLVGGGQVRYHEVVRRLVSPADVFAAPVSQLDLTSTP